jgi:raffinose/stachyose/melibiose transport system substrate-binding protein
MLRSCTVSSRSAAIKAIIGAAAVAFVIGGLAACAKKTEAAKAGEPVTLTFASWRTEDIERMGRINAVFTQQHPNITINFQPVNDSEYDANMRSGFETGTGADIVFLRSYDTGRTVYNAGWLYDLTKVIPNLSAFPPAAVKAWSTEDGIVYAAPSVGVTHGVYYQKAIFEKYGLKEPATWDEFIAVCETLKKNGENVFAQGAMDDWTLYEVVFSGLGANFYGGEAARQDLIAGKAKLTDPSFVSAFKAIDSLQKYLPKGYASLDYVSMQQMFGTGKAAMFIGGSWELGVFEDLGSDSTKIGWFAPPVKKAGDKLQYCFHVDAGIGVNKNSKNIDAALEYIKWVAGPEYAQGIMNELPGFFSYTPAKVTLTNPLAQKMFDAASGADLTVRTVWEKLSAQAPSGNSLMGVALPGMMVDKYTPEQAAKYVQDQLASWYPPFKKYLK